MAAVLIYFRADLWRIAARLAARAARRRSAQAQPRGEARLVHRPRHDPDLDLRLHLQGPDRVRRPQPLPDRLGADPLLLRDARSPSGSARRSAPSTRSNGRDGLFIGIAQALALVPGVSRSGATISAGLFRGFDRVAAARYSFLLSVPAVVLSGLFELRKVGEAGEPLGRGDGRRDPGRLRHRLRGDRLAAALPQHPHARDLRRLPDRPRRPGADPDRDRRDQLDGL